MAIPRLEPHPVDEPLLAMGRLSIIWDQWLNHLRKLVSVAPVVLETWSVSAQSASLAAKSLPSEVILTAGLYRVSWFTRVTQAATTSSSLTVTVRFTDGTVACAVSGAAMTGNTTGTTQSGSVLVRADKGSSVTVEAAYASVGGTPMVYGLDAFVERLP